MKILVTGAAGFIGFSLIRHLLSKEEYEIVGLDNINNYYDVGLKHSRLNELGITPECTEPIDKKSSQSNIPWGKVFVSAKHPTFRFVRAALEDDAEIERIFEEWHFDYVINLAAQAGVRYSIDHPRSYIKSNIDGFINILEGCRHTKVKHLIYASSSSVYGLNGKTPFAESDGISHPVSLYAATKKSNELMAHAYSYLYSIPTTGLRFFTVYGPWGRPDMSPFLFIDNILHNREIKVFNNGDMIRDFTYIDDIVESISRLISKCADCDDKWDAAKANPATSTAPYRIYNIGNSTPINLGDYIKEIERATGRTAKKKNLPMQPGDVYQTYADSSRLYSTIGFRPTTTLADGIDATVEWYRNYYKI